MAGRIIVFANCTEGTDAEFNRWYDEVHAHDVLSVGPITSCQRFRVSDAQAMDQTHRYLTIYEYEGSADDARDALLKESSGFAMSDTLADDALMSITEEIGQKVTSS